MTLEELAKRRKIEFNQKIEAIENEFTEWSDQSQDSQPFEKHNSQISSIIAHLEPWNASIQKALEKYENKGTDAFLKNCKNAVNLILTEHRIWDYFRQKFIQRKNESFRKYLRAADEFAWACYQPLQIAANSELKEPPLVFFNGGSSPFTISRQRSFQTELVDGNDINADITNEEILKLPISVVGIPWDQINHLPEASVIGHEVGHIVENDFGLTEDLQKLLDEALIEANANDSRKSAWDSWLSEIFADFYGCLSAGPAYAGTLLDFLADEKFTIENQIRPIDKWTAYPTNILRMRFIFKVLEKMDFKNEIKDYVEIYSAYKSKMLPEFEKDIDFIVTKLVEGKLAKLNNKSISEIFTFTKEQQTKVVETANRLMENNSTTTVELKSKDIRVIFAAARRSFELSPEQHVSKNSEKQDYDDIVLNWIETKVVEKGVRSGVTFSTYKEKLKKYKNIGENSIANILDEMFKAE